MLKGQWEIEFTKDGRVFDEDQVNAFLQDLPGATDLLVLSHGWNNDRNEATALYDELLGSLEKVGLPDSGRGSGIAVMRVLWPSKKFTLKSLIPGGGAASATSQSDAALIEALEDLKQDPFRLGETRQDPTRAALVNRALELVPKLESSLQARREYVLQIRALLDPGFVSEDDASREFFEVDPGKVFAAFSQPVAVLPMAGGGGAAGMSSGGAAFLGDLVDGAKAGARRLANYATYYSMKARASVVGAAGVASVLSQVRRESPNLPMHLVGHSFGGRLVTAAATTFPERDTRVSLVLLQAAFSHNGLAAKYDRKHDGAFRTVLSDVRVNGPVVITHTKNDQAVGVAYPLASRIARDRSSALGDQNDPYGGMGRNGAQHTPEVDRSESVLRKAGVGVSYAFKAGKVFNLLADKTISNHGDVRNMSVATALRDVVCLP
ncbi:hypothetical protein RAJCM14343_1685 [Rhodococcus aetherivorans]|uniref:Serine-threonine protein kinase n=1 Tax=Rhodococcus aetherivorans TaxID=191292 RepID=A0ABQ0YIX2_9NOCA|nr:hypothetical protein [Rhodococcus aetherivorans]ETT26863.1 hypothetical protein RR21198_2524 [Rhodococcus rhodochrous ATCC 21198]NGP29735.1 hypothetical protein [Rhodococcus aetherivorans]GES36434.1 hypothetical protein RAJCM14343_1685 [Rhodococcus aetherivorans]